MPEHTITENLARLTAARTAIAGAITAKGGTVAVGDGLEDFPADIATIPTGGSSVSENAVTFYDYDGTVVDSYTATEFANLSSMPNNPSHEGLTAQGWNWSLADAKAYVAKYGRLNIGQMYITSDGKTRIKIRLEEGRLSPVLGLGINGSVDVDWGDDTDHGTMTGSDVSTLVQLQHVYAAAGEYTIALTVTGSMTFLGDNTYSTAILRKDGVTSETTNESRVYQNAVQELYIGSGVVSIGGSGFRECSSLTSVTIPDSVTSIDAYAFFNCYGLASVTIPDGVTTISTKEFYSCSSLASVTIPDGVTTINGNVFYSCTSLASVTIPDSVTSIGVNMSQYSVSLTSVTIPDGVTSIGNYAFLNCYGLASVTIPDGVTSISNSAFRNCYGLGFIKFEGSTPPTAGSSDTFAGIPTDCIIYVPSGSLEDYEGETNYPDPDVYTYVEY